MHPVSGCFHSSGKCRKEGAYLALCLQPAETLLGFLATRPLLALLVLMHIRQGKDKAAIFV